MQCDSHTAFDVATCFHTPRPTPYVLHIRTHGVVVYRRVAAAHLKRSYLHVMYHCGRHSRLFPNGFGGGCERVAFRCARTNHAVSTFDTHRYTHTGAIQSVAGVTRHIGRSLSHILFCRDQNSKFPSGAMLMMERTFGSKDLIGYLPLHLLLLLLSFLHGHSSGVCVCAMRTFAWA